MTSAVEKEKTSPGNKKTLYIVVGVVVVLVLVGAVAFYMMRRKKNQSTGNTGGGSDSGGNSGGTTGNTSTDLSMLSLPANLSTYYCYDYKYYNEQGALVYFTNVQTNTIDTSTDISWVVGSKSNLYTQSYGSTNSLMTRYDVITNRGTSAIAYQANTSPTKIEYDSVFPVPAGTTNPTYPSGWTRRSTFYAFSSDTISSNSTLSGYVASGDIVPLGVYSASLPNSVSTTVQPIHAIYPGKTSPTYTISMANNVNPVTLNLIYTIYVSKVQPSQ